jgi:predicted DNA binding CopG/RHH family protein
MAIKNKKAPRIRSEKAAFEFWSRHDSTDYVDWSKAKKGVFPNLRPTSKLISIRFPVATLERIKVLATRQDIPYQSLIKIFINRGIDRELRPHL